MSNNKLGQMKTEAKIFSCTQSEVLAEQIAKIFGIPMGKVAFSHYSDGEFQPSFEESVRGSRVFLVGSTHPSSENLMELLLMIDAAKRASARHITAVMPYFGWARQDRKDKPRVPIGAKLIANLLEAAGATRIITMDLHADQIQGFFNIPIDNIYAQPVLVKDVLDQNYQDVVVVSPDVGGVARARAAAKRINDADLAIIDKRRPAPNLVKVMNVIGDVEGRTCIMIDDMVDTAGTLCQAAEILKEKGAKKVVAYATHAVLSGGAIENISNSKLDELVITNTIPLTNQANKCNKIRQLSIATTLADVIRRISDEQSISTIFADSD